MVALRLPLFRLVLRLAGRRGDLLQRFLTHGLVLIAAELAGESLEAVDLIGCGG
jgi:hypothetical protein